MYTLQEKFSRSTGLVMDVNKYITERKGDSERIAFDFPINGHGKPEAGIIGRGDTEFAALVGELSGKKLPDNYVYPDPLPSPVVPVPEEKPVPEVKPSESVKEEVETPEVEKPAEEPVKSPVVDDATKVDSVVVDTEDDEETI